MNNQCDHEAWCMCFVVFGWMTMTNSICVSKERIMLIPSYYKILHVNNASWLRYSILIWKCSEIGIDCLVWDHALGAGVESELVLVSLNKAVGHELRKELGLLVSMDRLNSSIIEEWCLILTAPNHRKKMAAVKELREFNRQLSLLTTTLPNHIMPAFSAQSVL